MESSNKRIFNKKNKFIKEQYEEFNFYNKKKNKHRDKALYKMLKKENREYELWDFIAETNKRTRRKNFSSKRW